MIFLLIWLILLLGMTWRSHCPFLCRRTGALERLHTERSEMSFTSVHPNRAESKSNFQAISWGCHTVS